MAYSEKFRLGGRCVLVAEDEVIIGMLAESAIHELGGRCAPVAATCEAALNALESENPHLILLDVNLKGGTSERVLDAAIAAGIPVVVSSGTDEAALPPKFQGLPMLKKPWTSEDMTAVFARALEKTEE